MTSIVTAVVQDENQVTELLFREGLKKDCFKIYLRRQTKLAKNIYNS